MNTYNLEEARQGLETMISLASDTNEQYRISTKSGNAVLLSEETYDNLLITLELLSTPGLIEGLEKVQKEEGLVAELAPAH